MHSVYLLSVFLHILAAIIWIGGMLFLVMVVVPWLRQGERRQASMVLAATGPRFRTIGWACFAVLFVTGLVNLWFRGVRVESLTDPAWYASPFGHLVSLKVLVFALVLTLSAVHDYYIGPRSTAAGRADPTSPEAERYRRAASYLGRANTILALLLVAFGVGLVRGCAW